MNKRTGFGVSTAPDKSVDFSNIDIVELLHRLLDLRLVGSQVHDED